MFNIPTIKTRGTSKCNGVPPRFTYSVIFARNDLAIKYGIVRRKMEALSDQRVPPQPPILCLPPEVISEVFIHCTPNNHRAGIVSSRVNDIQASPCADPFREPILLGNICRVFRDIAFSTPQLWSSITLTLHSCELSEELDRLKAWLARSKGCLLSIHIRCAPDTFAGKDAWAENPPFQAMEAIFPYCKRWEEIYLSLPMACFSHLNQMQGRMVMLRKMTLFRHGYTPLNEYSGLPIDAFFGSPKLEDVSLFGISPSSMTLPWSQLTGFRGYDLWEDEIMFVLNQSPHLLRCTFRAYLGDRALSKPSSPLQHHLRSISMSEHSGYTKYLTLPHLQKIKLKADDWCWNPRNMISLLTRSSCSLERLQLSVGFVSEEGLILCLSAIPTLKEFKLANLNDRVHSVFTDKVIRRLTSPGIGGPMLVPKLRSMDIFTCTLSFTPDLLVRMLWSRSRQGSSDEVSQPVGYLRTFRLSTSSPAISSVRHEVWRLPRMQNLEKEGMLIRIASAKK